MRESDAITLDGATPSPGRAGMGLLIATEAALFGYLLFSYFYLYLQGHESWPPEGPPVLFLPGLNTAILLSSSVLVWLCERMLKRGRRGRAAILLAGAVAAGGVFVAIQLHEWAHRPYAIDTNLYGSLYFTITGFHMAHVAMGLVMLGLLLVQLRLGHFRDRHEGLSLVGLYWHFVDAVWLFIFSVLYLLPHMVRA